MSREIKFRYWDIINEAMIEDAQLMDSLSEKIARPREYHVMQYTGLKDKDGVEIWEFDILQSHSEIVNISTGKHTGRWIKENYTIEWNPDNGCFSKRRHKNNRLDAFGLRQKSLSEFYTVIGNIYQDKKLLKEKE